MSSFITKFGQEYLADKLREKEDKMGNFTHSLQDFLERKTRARQRLASGIIKSGTTQKLTPVKAAQVAKHIGRNDPCLCRSGKKFKHCCLQPGELTRTDIARIDGHLAGVPIKAGELIGIETGSITGTHTPDLGGNSGTNNVPLDPV